MGHLPPAGGKDYAARIIIVIILYYSKCGGKGKEQNARPAQLAGSNMYLQGAELREEALYPVNFYIEKEYNDESNWFPKEFLQRR